MQKAEDVKKNTLKERRAVHAETVYKTGKRAERGDLFAVEWNVLSSPKIFVQLALPDAFLQFFLPSALTSSFPLGCVSWLLLLGVSTRPTQ